MSFWQGAMAGLTNWRREEADRNRDEAVAKQEGEAKVAQHLLESEDPEIQMAGLSILQAAMQPPKRKKGIRGSIGEYEQTAGLEPLLRIVNRFRGMVEGGGGQGPVSPPASLPPGSASLPPSSPVEPKAQDGPNPGLLSSAVTGAENDPASNPDQSFGGVPLAPPPSPLSTPQQFAADASTSPRGAINMGQVAGRVSRDRGVPRPGERARLFWPTKASQAAAAERAKMDSQVQVLQALGATPQQILSAVLASQGFASGGPTTSGEIEMQLPTGEKVLAYHYRDPRTGTAFLAYTGPSGQPTPLPPGAEPFRLPSASAAAGGSLTSYMTGEQVLREGIAPPEDITDLKGLYKVQRRGDTITMLPYQPPSPPPVAETGAGTSPRTGALLSRDRFGNVKEVPGTEPRLNAKVTAARALMAAVREQERISGLGTDIATLKRTVEQLVRSGQYPSLQGLTYEQISQLEKLDQFAPEEALSPVLGAQPAAPVAVPPPPSAAAAPPGAAPPAGWAKDVADEILRGRSNQPTPGVVQGRPPR